MCEERERVKRELECVLLKRDNVYACVSERDMARKRGSVCVCVCVFQCVLQTVRELESVCMCVCVCERDKGR